SGLVPFVTVTNASYNNQVHAANNEGFVSFVAHVGDTIRFTSVGFAPVEFVITETASDKFTAKINMKSLVIELPAVMPFPWASIEEFNMAFMELDVSDDNISRIRNSLSPDALDAWSQCVSRTSGEIQTCISYQRHNDMSNSAVNQRFANRLFSPFAWGSCINSVVRGDYSRKRLEY